MSVVDINKVKDNFSTLIGTDFKKIAEEIIKLKNKIIELTEQAKIKGDTNQETLTQLNNAKAELNKLQEEKVGIEKNLERCKSDLDFFTSQNDKIADALEEIRKINLDGGRRRRRRRSKRSKRSKKIKKSKRRNRY